MKKIRQKHKHSSLSFFQHALLSPIIQPDADLPVNPAAAIKAAQQALQAAGWTREEARAETRHKGS